MGLTEKTQGRDLDPAFCMFVFLFNSEKCNTTKTC